MPFKINKITASNLEQFKVCEEGVTYLNTLIQTLNGKEVTVNVSIFMNSIEVTSDFSGIKELRVMGNPEIKWIDYSKDYIMINTNTVIFRINFKGTNA